MTALRESIAALVEATLVAAAGSFPVASPVIERNRVDAFDRGTAAGVVVRDRGHDADYSIAGCVTYTGAIEVEMLVSGATHAAATTAANAAYAWLVPLVHGLNGAAAFEALGGSRITETDMLDIEPEDRPEVRAAVSFAVIFRVVWFAAEGDPSTAG